MDINNCSALHEILAYIPPYYSVVCKQWKQVYYEHRLMLYWLRRKISYIRYYEHMKPTDDMLLATTKYGIAKPTTQNVCINLCYGHIVMYKQNPIELNKVKHGRSLIAKTLIDNDHIDTIRDLPLKKLYKHLIKTDKLHLLLREFTHFKDMLKLTNTAQISIKYIFEYDAINSLKVIKHNNTSSLILYAKIFNATKILQYYGTKAKSNIIGHVNMECGIALRSDPVNELLYIHNKITMGEYKKRIKSLEYTATMIIALNKTYYKHAKYIDLFKLAVASEKCCSKCKTLTEIIRYGINDLLFDHLLQLKKDIRDDKYVFKKAVKYNHQALIEFILEEYTLYTKDIRKIYAKAQAKRMAVFYVIDDRKKLNFKD
jgi:hypothetical protein